MVLLFTVSTYYINNINSINNIEIHYTLILCILLLAPTTIGINNIIL